MDPTKQSQVGSRIEMAVLIDCLALRDVKIKVPQAVIKGKDAELQCSFDLEGEKLYSVKWYRGQYEFFRYTPADPEPVKIFTSNGINVRRSESRDTKIVLENVPREISGPYSCEVTAEVPSFFTVMQTAQLQVVDIPHSEPSITGLKRRYSLEDEVFQANCTSEPSYPAVNISWYINGFPIRGPQIRDHRFYPLKGYVTVISSIRHRLAKKFFQNGPMKLRCAASLYDVYYKSTEVSIELAERRRKNHQPDWPPTTKAPPYLLGEEDLDEEMEISIETPPKSTIRQLPPSSTSFHPAGGLAMILMPLFVSWVLSR